MSISKKLLLLLVVCSVMELRNFATRKVQLNINGDQLQKCNDNPTTGFYRDGYCKTDQHDSGTHTVCAYVTKKWLNQQKAAGNDLITPSPKNQFPGLKPGQHWCVCAIAWREGLEAGFAPKVKLGATNALTTKYVSKKKILQNVQPANK